MLTDRITVKQYKKLNNYRELEISAIIMSALDDFFEKDGF